jgi:hypothetical protein
MSSCASDRHPAQCGSSRQNVVPCFAEQRLNGTTVRAAYRQSGLPDACPILPKVGFTTPGLDSQKEPAKLFIFNQLNAFNFDLDSRRPIPI